MRTTTLSMTALLALAAVAGCSDDGPGADTETTDASTTMSSTESTTDTDTETETGTETGTGDAFPDCTPQDDALAPVFFAMNSDAWAMSLGPNDFLRIESARCTIDSSEHLPNNGMPLVNFWMTCVNDLDQAVYDDFVLQVWSEEHGSMLEFAVGTEVDIRFEHDAWVSTHSAQSVFTMRDLDGVLLFAGGSQRFSPTSLDADGPRWAWDRIAAPDTDPAAAEDWLAPLSRVELVDDACPFEPFDGFVADTWRRFGLRASDDAGPGLSLDRSSRTVTLDGRDYELVVGEALAFWLADQPENAVADVRMFLVITDG
ncbi:hypothetical protein [Enhygromyxa salina]|nr:hypothetical protein [Enhygromyxa salina]